MLFVGIDPGLKGYVCKLSPDNSVAFYPCPIVVSRGKLIHDPVAMAKVLCIKEPQFIVIEKQWARPQESKVAACTNCKGYGLWLGIIAALKLPKTIVAPVTWQKQMIPPEVNARALTSSKERTIAAAQFLFPNVDLKRTPRCPTLCHDKADALLLASYAQRFIERK